MVNFTLRLKSQAVSKCKIQYSHTLNPSTFQGQTMKTEDHLPGWWTEHVTKSTHTISSRGSWGRSLPCQRFVNFPQALFLCGCDVNHDRNLFRRRNFRVVKNIFFKCPIHVLKTKQKSVLMWWEVYLWNETIHLEIILTWKWSGLSFYPLIKSKFVVLEYGAQAHIMKYITLKQIELFIAFIHLQIKQSCKRLCRTS